MKFQLLCLKQLLFADQEFELNFMTFDGIPTIPLLQCSRVDSKKCLSANWAMPYVDSLSELGNETVPTARSSPGKIVKCKEIFFSKSIKIGWAIITIRRNTKTCSAHLKPQVNGSGELRFWNGEFLAAFLQQYIPTHTYDFCIAHRMPFPTSALVQT